MRLLKSRKSKIITALIALITLLVLSPIIIEHGMAAKEKPRPRITKVAYRGQATSRGRARTKRKASPRKRALPSKKASPVTGSSSADAVPILVYHDVAESTTLYSNKWLCLKPELFAQQLDWLKANGYHTVHLSDAYNHWYNGTPLPDKPIVLTFDDGPRSNYTTVLPMLQARGMTGTFLVCPGFFDNPEHMTSNMVAQLSAAGMEIGCHSYSHADLTKTTDDNLRHEVYDAKVAIENVIGKPVEFFCYPCGKYDDRVIAAVQGYGYKAALSSIHGEATSADNRYVWKRIPIGAGTNANGLAKLLK